MLPATDELGVLQALEKFGEVVSFQEFEKLLAGGEAAWTALGRAEVTAQFMQVSFCRCSAPGWQPHLCRLALGMYEALSQQGRQCTAGTVRACGNGSIGPFWAGPSRVCPKKQGLVLLNRHSDQGADISPHCCSCT